MKTLLLALTVATVIGSPALAQSYDPGIGTGNLNARPYRTEQTIQSVTPYDARAQLGRFDPTRVNVPRGKRSGRQ
jgi:hypothetical protein